ncbi:MAG: hypothetical protein ACUVXA_15685 [Candidatus Jordarchaeum sp.]|uniref:hypothetical protein n=1 Tax=Candidatus Jordarchaeum sp. TaxID=2823881 RepID=UPI00404AFF0B
MFYLLFFDQFLDSVWNFFVNILYVLIVITAIWLVILAIITWKKPDLGFSILGAQLKITWKILAGIGKLLWKGKKVLLVIGVFAAVFLTTTVILPDYSWFQGTQLLISLVFSSTATTTLVAAVKRKRGLALKLLGLTATLTAISFLFVTLLLPNLTTITGVNLTGLYLIGGAALIGSGAAIAYTKHQKRVVKENAEKDLMQELEWELDKNKAPLISLKKQLKYLRLVRIPENYMENLREHAESQLNALRDPSYASLSNTESRIFSGVPQFQGLIKALGNVRVTVRTDFHNGMATIGFLAEPEHLLKLKRVLESHIPGIELKIEIANSNRPYSQASVVRLENAVPNSPTPLRPLYDHFIQNVLNGFVDIYLNPHGDFRDAFNNAWMNYSYKQFKKREKEDGNAINYSDEQKMQRMRKTLEEGRTRVGVYAAVYNNSERNEKGTSSVDALASVLASGFRSANGSGSAGVSHQFSHTIKKFQGIHAGANLELTNLEAAAVLQIQIPVETQGFRVDKTADFPVSSPGSSGEEGLWLGWLTRGGKILEEKAYLNLESVNQHVLIGGSTGR